ncbi:MFS transporter [Morganella morganii]|uniref:MFS transporter n=1 Tax=Morganella morganii TaxID=582 RepID=UPI0016517725|nr:MFS transporter [Morganella morganii]MBC6656823.1 MFS transporter [Morganella morganii]
MREQLTILQRRDVWLSIAAVTLIFSAMFAGFSYIAGYLVTITGFSNNTTSALLVVFGISGYFGNFIFSRYLQRNVIKTTSLYPLLFILILPGGLALRSFAAADGAGGGALGNTAYVRADCQPDPAAA